MEDHLKLFSLPGLWGKPKLFGAKYWHEIFEPRGSAYVPLRLFLPTALKGELASLPLFTALSPLQMILHPRVATPSFQPSWLPPKCPFSADRVFFFPKWTYLVTFSKEKEIETLQAHGCSRRNSFWGKATPARFLPTFISQRKFPQLWAMEWDDELESRAQVVQVLREKESLTNTWAGGCCLSSQYGLATGWENPPHEWLKKYTRGLSFCSQGLL